MTAAAWLERWDAQQELYLPDREERFDVIVDIVEAVAGAEPRVIDLACGPASLSRRLLARLSGAEVVGIDADPVLLDLARADMPAGLTLVDADLRDPDWTRRLPDGRYDAIVSTTALHWLTEPELRELYRACRSLLRPGGVFADGDHFRSAQSPQLVEVALELDRRRALRKGTEAEDWSAWWAAVEAAPEFRDAVAERGRRTIQHPDHSETSREVHEHALHAAGFAEVGVLWQKGTDAVLTAIR